MSDLIHLLASVHSLELLEAAFATGRSPNEKDQNGRRAFCHAAGLGSIDLLQVFLAAGADVNEPNEDALGYTPLIEAVRQGRKEAVALLLDHGADIEGRDSRRGTALLNAAIVPDLEIIELLLDRGAEVDPIDVEEQTPVHFLCRYAKEWAGVVYYEVVDGVEREIPNTRYEQHLRAVELLLSRGADPNRFTAVGFTALHHAAESDAHEMVPILVRGGADPNRVNAKGYAPLHAAADRGNVRALEALLDAGAHVDIGDELGITPLMGALFSYDVDTVRLLLARGASPTAKATGSYDRVAAGDTAIDIAKKLHAGDAIMELLEEAARAGAR